MAIRIYLDTQDYIRFFENKEPETEKIFKYLIEKVDSGEIEIAYSYFIIAEFLTDYSESYKEDRLRRVYLLQRLCKSNSFVYVNRLLVEDSVFSYKGDWLPYIPVLRHIKTGMEEEIKKIIQKMPRRQRRKLNKSNPLRDFILSNPQIYNQRLNQNEINFPLPESFVKSNLFMRFLCGEVSDEAMEREFQTLLFDLEKFIQLWFEYGQKGSFLYNSIKEHGQSFIKLIENFQDVLRKATEGKDILSTYENILKEAGLHKYFKQDIKTSKEQIKQIEKLDLNYVRGLIKNEEFFTTFPETFIELVISYVRGSVKIGRKSTGSDAGDLMHAIYLPYCDLWRGDKSFTNILIQEKVAGYENIVSKLVDLPSRIENKLTSSKE